MTTCGKNIESVLSKYGFKQISKREFELGGIVYVFDEEFVEKLSTFLADEDVSLDRGEFLKIKEFLAYADGADDSFEMKKLDEYLASKVE